jgi:N-acyl-D-aspartate/D-glutamate deacylase
MHERALEDATPEDIAMMAKLVEEGLLAGALGFSTGRTAGHRDARGNFVPGTYAALEELDALVSAIKAAGRGVLQVVPAGVGGFIIGDAPDALTGELDWMVEHGLRTGIPITFSVNQQGTITGEGDLDHWKPWFERCREANSRGANIRPQVGARCFGLLIGLQSRLNPLQYRPTYKEIAELPLAQRVEALRTPSIRERILGERGDYSGMMMADHFRRGTFEVVYPLVGLGGGRLDYEPGPDQSVAAIARATGRDPWEITYDLMLEGDGRNFLLMPLLNYGGGSYDAVREMIMDPMTIQGLGDGGAHVGLVVDASVNTYLLQHWVRDRTRGERIPLEYAVQRLTSDPAGFYGIPDRGVIAAGMQADLNLIDFDTLGIDYPELVHDLPSGASRLVQRSFGYVSTIVAGEEVVADGELTDARPGRLIRSR